MKVQTFTEFVGKLPEFEDDEEDYDLAGYVYSMEEKYCKRHNADWVTRLRVFLYGLRGPLLEKHPDSVVNGLETEQKLAYNDAYKALNIYLARRMLGLRHFRGNVLDFGCGSGGSSIFLANQGDDITAIDKNPDRIDELKKTDLFPEEKAISGNGLDYMLLQPESSFDLIIAFGLGVVNCPVWFAEQFYIASTRAIKPNGRILVESDMLTMDKVREVFGVRFPPYGANVMISRPQKLSARQ